MWSSPRSGDIELRDGIPKGLKEPYVPVRPGGDPRRSGCVRLAGFGDGSRGCDPPDLVANFLGEPQVPVRPGRDADGDAGGGGNGELGDGPGRGDPPDLVPAFLGEPQVPVRPGRDALGPAVGGGAGELHDDPGRSDSPDLVAAILGEPEVPVRPGCDHLGAAVAGRDGEHPKSRGRASLRGQEEEAHQRERDDGNEATVTEKNTTFPQGRTPFGPGGLLPT